MKSKLISWKKSITVWKSSMTVSLEMFSKKISKKGKSEIFLAKFG